MSYLNNTITSYKQFDDFTYSSCISMLCMCLYWLSPLNVATCHDDLQETYLFRSCNQYNLFHRSTCMNSLHPHMCHGRNTWLWHNRRHLQSNWQAQRNDTLYLHICRHHHKHISLHVKLKRLCTVSHMVKVPYTRTYCRPSFWINEIKYNTSQLPSWRSNDYLKTRRSFCTLFHSVVICCIFHINYVIQTLDELLK